MPRQLTKKWGMVGVLLPANMKPSALYALFPGLNQQSITKTDIHYHLKYTTKKIKSKNLRIYLR
jgi:hypothetical protein